MMKVAYTGWTWINNRDPEAAKRLLENSFRECKFLGYDYVENFAFIRDYYAENPQELVDLTKDCGVNLVNLYGHFTFDVEKSLEIAKAQVKFLADIGGKWYNCQNGGFRRRRSRRASDESRDDRQNVRDHEPPRRVRQVPRRDGLLPSALRHLCFLAGGHRLLRGAHEP